MAKQLQLFFYLFVCAIAKGDDVSLEDVLHAGINKFTANMFSEVVKENQGKSVVISGFSVITPLAQLALASVGPSHDEILNCIGLQNDNITKSVFSLVEKRTKSFQGVELKAANKVYIPLDYELNSDYAAMLRDVFHSEIAKVNFLTREATAKEINAWVEDQTNNRIKDLITCDSLGNGTRVIFVNALYFKGSCLTPFLPYESKDKDFHVSKEKTVTVPMMFITEHFKYHKSKLLNSQILEMPYVGEETSMLIIFPNEIDGITELLENLKDFSILDVESKNLKLAYIDVSIPKFKIESTTNLKHILQKMNVTKIFDEREAKLYKLLKDANDFYVNDAIQKVFIEVNAKGTEAAAANEFSRIVSGPIAHFNANHPFVFFLKENNNILFSGMYFA